MKDHIAYTVTFTADTEGNWCSQSAGYLYPTRAAAQAAIDADETAQPDPYGNRCYPHIEERSMVRELANAGYDVLEYSDGGLYVPVLDGEQGDGSEVDGKPELEEIRLLVAPFGASAEWSGDSNTDSDGDTTSDVVIGLIDSE